VPLTAEPLGFLICVRFARHSIGLRCGRTIGFLRGNLRPCFSAASMSPGMISHARPAFSGLTPLMRNIVEGYSMLPVPSPTSYGTPDQAARSPSPEPSTNTLPRTANLPDFVSTSTASMRRSSAITAPEPNAWNSTSTPASAIKLSAALLNAEMSYDSAVI